MNGRDRDEVLSQMLELLAIAKCRGRGDSRAHEPPHHHHHGGRSRGPQPSLDALCRRHARRPAAPNPRRSTTFAAQRQSLRARAGAVFPLRHPSLSHSLPRRAARRRRIPFAGYDNLLKRRFEEAIEIFLAAQAADGPSAAISSALAAAYRALGFQTLADQVRRSVRTVRGNQWMFRAGHPEDYPLRIRPELLAAAAPGLFPILREATPVRMDLTPQRLERHFLSGNGFSRRRARPERLDRPERARRRRSPKPPVEAWFRVIDQPVLRLVSVDLQPRAEVSSIAEVFDFAHDYLGLAEGGGHRLRHRAARHGRRDTAAGRLFWRLTGRPGHGIEIVSKVNDIPKGSRLAVSTNLLACMISVCMRATGQIRTLTGGLGEDDRRLVAARAILGEWLGGSGGGWQDSGGVWPGIKLIHGVAAQEGDPEFGISRGRLLPGHRDSGAETKSPPKRAGSCSKAWCWCTAAWRRTSARFSKWSRRSTCCAPKPNGRAAGRPMRILDEIVGHLQTGDIRGLGASTERNFDGPIQTIIPWAGNLYTETLIGRVREEMGGDFWGFWMLGGMSGGGMGFHLRPRGARRAARSACRPS